MGVNLRKGLFRLEMMQTLFMFGQLAEFFDILDEGIAHYKEKGAVRFKKEMEIFKEKTSSEEIVNMEFANQERKLNKYVPMHASYCFVTMIYSLFENRLKAFSDFISTEKSFSVSVSDFEGDLATKIRNFSKTFKVSISSEKDLNLIKEFTKLRNCIVHDYGFVKENSSFYRYCKTNKNIEINKMGKIIKVDSGWCHDVLIRLQELLQEMYLSVGKKTRLHLGARKSINQMTAEQRKIGDELKTKWEFLYGNAFF